MKIIFKNKKTITNEVKSLRSILNKNKKLSFHQNMIESLVAKFYGWDSYHDLMSFDTNLIYKVKTEKGRVKKHKKADWAFKFLEDLNKDEIACLNAKKKLLIIKFADSYDLREQEFLKEFFSSKNNRGFARKLIGKMANQKEPIAKFNDIEARYQRRHFLTIGGDIKAAARFYLDGAVENAAIFGGCLFLRESVFELIKGQAKALFEATVKEAVLFNLKNLNTIEETIMQNQDFDVSFSSILSAHFDSCTEFFSGNEKKFDFKDFKQFILQKGVVIVIIADEESQSDLNAKLLLQMIRMTLTSELGVPVSNLPVDIIPSSRACNESRVYPILLEGYSRYQVRGMGVVSSQFRALGISTIFQINKSSDLLFVNEQEARSIEANTSSTVFLSGSKNAEVEMLGLSKYDLILKNGLKYSAIATREISSCKLTDSNERYHIIAEWKIDEYGCPALLTFD